MLEYINQLGVPAIVVILILREILPHFSTKNEISTVEKYQQIKTLAGMEESINKINQQLEKNVLVTTKLVERVADLRTTVREAMIDCRRDKK